MSYVTYPVRERVKNKPWLPWVYSWIRHCRDQLRHVMLDLKNYSLFSWRGQRVYMSRSNLLCPISYLYSLIFLINRNLWNSALDQPEYWICGSIQFSLVVVISSGSYRSEAGVPLSALYGELRQCLHDKKNYTPAILLHLEQLPPPDRWKWRVASVNWRVASVKTSYHIVKITIGKH